MTLEMQRFNLYAEKFSLEAMPENLRRRAPLPHGMPFLVTKASRDILLEPFAYSLSICDVPKRRAGAKVPIATALTYLNSVKGFAETVRGEGMPLRFADQDHLEQWVAEIGELAKGEEIDGWDPRTVAGKRMGQREDRTAATGSIFGSSRTCYVPSHGRHDRH